MTPRKEEALASSCLGGEPKRPLPDGWRWVRLGEVIAEAQPGFACGARDPEGVIQLRMNNVDTRGNLIWDKFIRVPADEETVSRYRLVSGDVVFNNTNSTELVGKSALFTGYVEPVVYSNHFTRLRVVSDSLFPEFLAYSLLLEWQARTFENLCNRWIGQSAVKNDKLLALEIPLPPLSEQKRIAGVLREQMGAVERARAAAEAQRTAAHAIPAAYLRAVFNTPEAQAWPRRRVAELCDRINYGYTASADFTVAEPRLLRITDIQEGRVAWQQVPGCRIDAEDEAAHALADGDIVFARTGATTGKSFLIRQPPRAVFASYLIRLRLTGEMLPDFVYAFFQSPDYWRQVRENVRGAGQPNLNASLLGAMTVPVPPLADQQRIAARLAGQMAAAERLREGLEEQLEALAKLPASLLRRAFSGEPRCDGDALRC